MNEKNPLLTFFVGVALLGAGLYWLFNSVTVESGFHFGAFRIGSMDVSSGLVIVPLIIGVFWWVMKPDSFFAKVMTVLGVVIIVASIIASVHFYFQRRSLYEYSIMILMIVAGAGLLARVLLTGNGNDKNDKKDKRNKKDDNNDYNQYLK
ncbi:MAG: hypothetical protein HFJ09_02285 [Lachnospiraceae bacterium]|nr:hypothetical protein [Lachnospiraceae bacterium]